MSFRGPYPAEVAPTNISSKVALPAIEREEQWVLTLRVKTAPDRVIGVLNLRKGDEDNCGFWLVPSCQRED